MGLSRGEQLRRKREAEKLRRKRIQEDPELRAELNEKRRKRYAKTEAQRKKKKESKKTIERRRKKWRMDKARQKEKRMLTQSNKVGASSESTRAKTMTAIAKKRAETRRVKHYYLVKQLKSRVEALKRRVHRYEMRYHRMQKKVFSFSDSPQSILDRDLKSVSKKISPQVRRKLLFSAALASDVNHAYKSTKSIRQKRSISERILFKYVKKYRFISAAKPYFYQTRKFDNYRASSLKNMRVVKKVVQEFFEDDAISTLSPNKCDTITRKKMKKQKRYLQNSLKYLFIEFCEKNSFVLSYSLFCRLRPFWVVNQKVSGRDTCLCKKHENVKLMCQKLKKLNIMNHTNVDQLIKTEMCCLNKPVEEDCLFRKCDSCRDNSIIFHEFDGYAQTYYESWRTVREEGRDGKLHQRTIKTRVHCTIDQMVTEFWDVLLKPYMKHVGYIQHQYAAIKQLKDVVSENSNSALIHIDFSENFQCKYFNEIQSIHFGGNRMQVTLHTGVLYSGEHPAKSFCTISPDLAHDPVAILKHLEPILLENTYLENLHFLSDSPSTQYRNQFMYYVIMKNIIPLFPNLKRLTWNYSEAGHGKGAPDGVGATVKRTCDRIVSYGVQDVANFQQFAELVQKEITGIQILVVDARDENLRKIVAEKGIPVKGSMKVHQVIWEEKNRNQLFFNSLSCFDCDTPCKHYYLTSVEYLEDSIPEEFISASVQSSVDIVPGVEAAVDEQLFNNTISNSIQFTTADFVVGDFIVVNFTMKEKTSTVRRFLGRILQVKPATVDVKFLTLKNTKYDYGLIYSFPEIDDIVEDVQMKDVFKKLYPPEKLRRGGFKFNISSKDW